jgi:hypothetical protein
VQSSSSCTIAAVSGVDTAVIRFAPAGLPPASVDALLAEGTCMRCAGGLMVEHPLVVPHITRIDGTQVQLREGGGSSKVEGCWPRSGLGAVQRVLHGFETSHALQCARKKCKCGITSFSAFERKTDAGFRQLSGNDQGALIAIEARCYALA